MASDRISTFLGAPPHHWKVAEIAQMKQIHRCFRTAFSTRNDDEENVGFVDMAKADDNFALYFGDNNNMAAKFSPPAQTKQKRYKPKNLTEEGDEEEAGKKSKAKKEKAATGDLGGDEEDDEISVDGKDEEWYLPKDSPLRSKDCDKKQPLNPTFKDFDSFVRSCEFDYWREHFDQQNADRFLSEIAESIVKHICNAQSRNQLRVKNGNVPLRKKREHITPLALVLHELKLWATHVLRPSNIFLEETFREIRYRIVYIEYLAHKEVWGDSALFLAAGMRPIAHDKLFRLLLTAKEGLEKAQQYAYRGYCRRSSREKLATLSNLLKNVLMNEMKLISGSLTLGKKQLLADPKVARLSPTDLLNTIENQVFVDYKNMANVLLYALCQNPLVKASLMSDFDTSSNNSVESKALKVILDDISNWTQSNLFCKPNSKNSSEPMFLFDKRKQYDIIPAIYEPTADKLKELIKVADPRRHLPLKPKSHVKQLITAYGSHDAAQRVMQHILKCCAACQEIIPNIYLIHTLWSLAGEGGDFTVYDTLRQEVLRTMSDTLEKVFTLRMSSRRLRDELNNLTSIAVKKLQEQRVKTGKAVYQPAWIRNVKWLKIEMARKQENVVNETLNRLVETAHDAFQYDLTAEELNDKVEMAKQLCNNIVRKKDVGDSASALSVKGSAKNQEVEKDWLKAENEVVREEEFGKNNLFGDKDNGVDLDDSDLELGNEEAEKFNPFENPDDSDSY